MRLYEEYLQRHQLTDIPVVHHCQAASVLLEINDMDLFSSILERDLSSNMPPYGILNLIWEHKDHHPGHYEIFFSHPLHDGYKNNPFSTFLISTIKWHEYESYVLGFCDRVNGVTPVRDQRLISLAAWEMFVYSYDHWFFSQSGEIKYLLFESLDKDNGYEKRLGFCQELVRKLSINNSPVVRVWKNEVCNKVQYHADWLANLIEKKCQKNILLLG